VDQAARDAGRPLPSKEGLTSAEREELTRMRRLSNNGRPNATFWQRLRPGLPVATIRAPQSHPARVGLAGIFYAENHVIEGWIIVNDALTCTVKP
jgi:hypothetical protein